MTTRKPNYTRAQLAKKTEPIIENNEWIAKLWKWLCTHKDWAHFIGGFAFGFVFGFAASVAAAVTSEVKDVQWGGGITIMDAVITMAGGLLGAGLRALILWLSTGRFNWAMLF